MVLRGLDDPLRCVCACNQPGGEGLAARLEKGMHQHYTSSLGIIRR